MLIDVQPVHFDQVIKISLKLKGTGERTFRFYIYRTGCTHKCRFDWRILPFCDLTLCILLSMYILPSTHSTDSNASFRSYSFIVYKLQKNAFTMLVESILSNIIYEKWNIYSLVFIKLSFLIVIKILFLNLFMKKELNRVINN